MDEDEQQEQHVNDVQAPWPNGDNGNDDDDQGDWAEDSDGAWQGEPPGAGAGAGAGADAADVVMPPHGAAVATGLQAVGDAGALAAQVRRLSPPFPLLSLSRTAEHRMTDGVPGWHVRHAARPPHHVAGRLVVCLWLSLAVHEASVVSLVFVCVCSLLARSSNRCQ